MDANELNELYLRAAHVSQVPRDVETPRYVERRDWQEVYDKVSTCTRIWRAADDDSGRRAELEAAGASQEVHDALMRHLGQSHNRLPLSEIEWAVRELGIAEADNRYLSPDERSRLDTDGYINLGKLIDDDQLARMRERFDQGIDKEGETSGHEVSQMPGIGRLSGTVLKAMNRDGLLDPLVLHPRLLAAVRHVLGVHFKYSSSNFHCPLPGYGHQSIHTDWGWGVRHPEVVNAVWMIDDFTLRNGPTRVVPGSHRWGIHPFEDRVGGELRDKNEEVEGECYITGEAGSCLVYVAHLWHGGTQNRSHGLRRAQHAFYTRSIRPTQTDALAVLDDEVYARLDRVQRAVFDLP